MLNWNKVQNSINSAYFDEISQIQVRHVDVDFEVDRLFSQYQMPPKKTKLKINDPSKYKIEHKKTSQSSISTKERSGNQQDTRNLQKQLENKTKNMNVHSLKKSMSKKILYIESVETNKPIETTVKKTARKKTVYSEFQKIDNREKKPLKAPQIVKIDKKMSKTKDLKQNFIGSNGIKRSQQEQQNPIRKSRQQSVSNKNENTIKKSRSESIISNSRQRLSSKNCMSPKVQKLKEENRKIIMRDYFGEDEIGSNQKRGNTNANNDLKTKRSNSKASKDNTSSRQRIESKSRDRMISKSRQGPGLKNKERVLVFSFKNKL